jgi:hypothetical protein
MCVPLFSITHGQKCTRPKGKPNFLTTKRKKCGVKRGKMSAKRLQTIKSLQAAVRQSRWRLQHGSTMQGFTYLVQTIGYKPDCARLAADEIFKRVFAKTAF